MGQAIRDDINIKSTFSGDDIAHAKGDALRLLLSTPNIKFRLLFRFGACSLLDEQSLYRYEILQHPWKSYG